MDKSTSSVAAFVQLSKGRLSFGLLQIVLSVCRVIQSYSVRYGITALLCQRIRRTRGFCLSQQISERLLPALARNFDLAGGAGRVSVHDAFVVRYDEGRQRHLPLHRDQSTHSFTVSPFKPEKSA